MSAPFKQEIISFIKTETPILHKCLQRNIYQDVYPKNLDEIIDKELNSFWENLHPDKQIGVMIKETQDGEQGHLTLFHTPCETEVYMLDVSKNKKYDSYANAYADIVLECQIDPHKFLTFKLAWCSRSGIMLVVGQ